jgi:hypothetical protein
MGNHDSTKHGVWCNIFHTDLMEGVMNAWKSGVVEYITGTCHTIRFLVHSSLSSLASATREETQNH